MKRVYHPYWDWEEWKAGMWNPPSRESRPDLLSLAVRFTGDHDAYGEAMMQVIKAWPKSSEHNLTATNMNRLAWVGHAAACFAHGIPEDVTREAWGILSEEQRIAADKKAEIAVQAWEMLYEKENQQLCLIMEEEGL